MDVAKWTMTLQRGEPFKMGWTVEQSEDGTDWTPLQTAGYSVLHQIRDGRGEDATLLLDISGGGWVSVDDAGTITWDVPKDAVLDVPAGVWWHDVALVDGSGNPTYVAAGEVSCLARISVLDGG